MPFPATPSPFRLSRRQLPARRSNGPQFANSPRFVLSQSTPDRGSQAPQIDDDAPSSTAPVAATPVTRRNITFSRSQREVIDDSDDGDLPRSTAPIRRYGNSRADERIDSTPPDVPDEASISLDTEYDEGYEPLQDSNKRRRVEEEPYSAREEDAVSDPNQSYNQSFPACPSTPVPHLRTNAALPTPNPQFTPAVPVRPTSLATCTPASTKTPFRNQPRFVLSTKKPPSTQPFFRAETPAASQPSSTPFEQRQPAILLPELPVPKPPTDDIPPPFSPSSRTLRRRGRKRDGGSYVPGGMAAEVRGWILDTGSKREQAKLAQPNTQGPNDGVGKYILTARVLSASQLTLSSSGMMAFIRAEVVHGDVNDDEVNVLALGPPQRKRKAPSLPGSHPWHLRVGDVLGFHRGLAWDIDLQAASVRARIFPEDQHVLSGVEGSDHSKQRWLVAMEWDFLEENQVSET